MGKPRKSEDEMKAEFQKWLESNENLAIIAFQDEMSKNGVVMELALIDISENY